ncbi:MAG: sulfatase-like hydrolase/transferase [Reichenbachiella sp.]
MKIVKGLLLCQLALGLSSGYSNDFFDQKPNIVLILIDDLSHYGVTAYGADRVTSNRGRFENTPISTPRIDKLAEEGVLFNHAFAYPLCESTRIALMSGKNNNRNYLRCKSQHASDITFGDTFKAAGYVTGMYGKWKQTRGTKEVSGKDYISEFGWDDYTCFDVIGEGQRFINPNLVRNGQVLNYNLSKELDPETGRRWYGPDICNRDALKFIENHQNEPFFLYYPMLLVHDDHKPTPDTKPNSIFDNFDEANNNRNGHTGDDHLYFPDMLSYLDKLIGKIVDKIDDLGLRENTLIIVMGDNGTKESFTHVFPDGRTYPGRKGGNADNGLHVPLVVSMPGTIAQGTDQLRTYDGLTNLTDIYPTIAEAGGVDVGPIDGKSFWNQLIGNTQKEHRETIYTWYSGNSLYTEEDVIIEYAFNKEFKRYAPSKNFPNGRFFDLRTDLLERKGDRHVDLAWGIKRFSGLKIHSLDEEQKKAYDLLGEILEENEMKPVKSLKIVGQKKKMHVGDTIDFSVEIQPVNATRNQVIWESNNPAVMSVDKFGSVIAKESGTAILSIFSWDDAYPTSANEPLSYFRGGIKDQINIVVE